MSVRVNVPNNPVTVKRSNPLLTDVEFAKKQEWERRRKLRLLQVRQQAKDLACSLRNKVRSEKEGISKEREKKCNEELDQWKKYELRKLDSQYEGCVAQLGSAHSEAQNQPDEGAILREQHELMAALSRARGEVAMQKIQQDKSAGRQKYEAAQNCRQMARTLENMRAQMVASLPKPPSTLPITPKKTTTAKSCSPSGKVCKKKTRSAGSVKLSPMKPSDVRHLHRNFVEASTETAPPERDKNQDAEVTTKCKSPPSKKLMFDEPPWKAGPSRQNPPNISSLKSSSNKHCTTNNSVSPIRRRKHNISECDDYNSDDSADSDVTWPPRCAAGGSTSAALPKLVQVYDHNSRTCHQHLRSAASVTCIPSASPQVELTPETLKEEGGRVYKADLEVSVGRAKRRGRKALRKDHLRKEFSSMLQELTTLDREERLRIIHCDRYKKAKHPKKKDDSRPPLDVSILCKNVSEEKNWTSPAHKPSNKLNKESVPTFTPIKHHVKIPMDNTKPPNEDTEHCLKQLLDTIQKKRNELVNKQFQYLDRDTATTCSKYADKVNEESDDDIEIPEWITEPSPSDVTPSCRREEEQDTIEKCIPPEVNKEQTDNSKSEENEKQESPTQTSKRMPIQTTPKRNLSKQPVKENSPVKETILVEHDICPGSVGNCEHSSPPRKECVRQEESQDSIVCSEVSSSSFEGIQLVIKVGEKKGKSPPELLSRKIPDQKEPDKTEQENLEETKMGTPSWHSKLNHASQENSGSTSTSYYSPPEYLNPNQKGLLNSILSRIEEKNKNPKLKQYILKLLEMSKESIDNLSESVSDISIQSDVINRINDAYADHSRPVQNGRQTGASGGYAPQESVIRHESLSGHHRNSVKFDVVTENKEVGTDSLVDTEGDCDEDGEAARLYTDLAERYSQRIRALAQMISGLNVPSPNLDDTSYLNAPCQINESVKMSDSLIHIARSGLYPRPEHTFDQSNNYCPNHLRQSNFPSCQSQTPVLNDEDIAALGLTKEILPKPDIEKVVKLTSERVRFTTKPPSTLGGISLRKHIPFAVPHELSAITEAETPSTSRYQQSLLNDRGEIQRVKTTPHLMEEELISCSSSEADLDLSSIAPCSPEKVPQKIATNNYNNNICDYAIAGPSTRPDKTLNNSNLNESSLSIISDMSDCSLLNGKGALSESSSENLEEVFRSLGIAWAWTTLRKIKEAKQLNSSSSSSPDRRQKPDCGPTKTHSRYKHSTPVKKVDRPSAVPVITARTRQLECQTSFGGSELSSVAAASSTTDSWSLTPPSVTLVTPSLVHQPQQSVKKTH